jgi:hypothetical protein
MRWSRLDVPPRCASQARHPRECIAFSRAKLHNLKVAVQRGEIRLSVDYGLTGAGHPHLFLRSSASSAPVLDEQAWPTGLPWSVVDRLRNGGDEKGRVLGIWQELPGTSPVPLAVLAWHAHGGGLPARLCSGRSQMCRGIRISDVTAAPTSAPMMAPAPRMLVQCHAMADSVLLMQ